ncbi:MAG: prepilin-type N-terminal cleavage/methylation domain-containing protein [Arenicellales bacterium]|nr:prepilin-type N-terminal cleavage/methylation domain-containing protein [Arenicellales bacterium]
MRENNTTALAKGCRNKNQRGFTLLEIMVVVILVVLTVSLIGVNLGRDLDQIAQLEASRFARLVEHVRDQSILSGEVYAIEVDDRRKTYQFLQASRQWHPVTKDDVLRPRYFPDYLSVRFDILQRSETDQRMLLVVQGLGEITPFRLSVEGDKFVHVVTLDDSLNVKVDRVNRDAS